MFKAAFAFYCLISGFVFAQNPGVIENLRTTATQLPAAVGLWPLNWLFTYREAYSTGIQANFTGSSMTLTPGPTGVAGGAHVINVGSNSWVEIKSDSIIFGTSSFTIIAYINTANVKGPILYYRNGASDGASLWLWPHNDNLYAESGAVASGTNACPMGAWQFIGFQYDATQGAFRILCNATFSGWTSIAAAPITTNQLWIGHKPAYTPPSNAKIACLAIYNTSLNTAQTALVKKQCELFQSLTCSENCVSNTCYGDLVEAAGWKCTCKAGWNGPDCNTPICTNPCPTGDYCAYPETCAFSSNTSMCKTVASDADASCSTWAALGHCLSNPSFMWSFCSTTCQKYASCECASHIYHLAPIDTSCSCGDLATLGTCETDDIMATNCSLTCGRRKVPTFNCTDTPDGVTLPANSRWVLSAPPNATFGSRAAYLQTATIACNFGYEPDGTSNNGMYICDPFNANATSGNWRLVNAKKPVCSPIRCPTDPPDLAYGYWSNTTTNPAYLYGEKVTYHCQAGYIMSGTEDPTANCSIKSTKETWTFSDGNPKCILPPCEPAIEAVNGYYNVSANETGGIATYACHIGYSASSDPSFFIKECIDDGSWVPGGRPICSTVKCPAPTDEENAYYTGLKDVYYYGDTVQTYCATGSQSLFVEPGTESTPLHTITKKCLDTGKWSTDTLTCLKIQCPAPEDFEINTYRIMNSSSQIDTIVFDMVIAFECDWTKGFEPSANQSIKNAFWRCTENSTWHKTDLKCSQLAALKSDSQALAKQTTTSEAATVTGSLILGILVMFLGIIVCLDYVTVSRDIRRLRHNWSAFVKRVRDETRIKQLHVIRHRLRNKVVKDVYLKKLQEKREKQLLAMSGLVRNETSVTPALVPNPFLGHSKASGVEELGGRYFNPPPLHKEGEMEIPADPNLGAPVEN